MNANGAENTKRRSFRFVEKRPERGVKNLNRISIYVDGKLSACEAKTGEKLSDVLLREGLRFPMPCGGNHTCGKCKLKACGALSLPTPDELKFLTDAERENGVRLACFARVEGDCEVFLSENISTNAILSETASLPFSAFSKREGVGLAVDIGTTTVVSYLYSLENGTLLSVRSGMNAQRGFGADVISRINYANENGVEPLRLAITEQLDGMVRDILSSENLPADALCEIVIAGNTTMLHLLTGLDPYGIAVYPFTPKSLFGETLAPGFFREAPAAAVRLPGCISSYVGGDITCSILASGMMKEKASLLLDLGTNGEMALWYGGKLFCCSTAAGPAFEGAGMQMGMTAIDGAISKVGVKDRQLWYSVLGEGAAKGVCGSGIIDAVASFVHLGLIDETGRIDEDAPDYVRYGTEFDGFPALKIGESGVILTQQDIRKLQLAKSAVAAGVLTLLHESGCAVEEIETMYLAGGFGTYLDLDSAAAIGLFPAPLKRKAKTIGNGAGAGAALLLLDCDKAKDEKEILEKAEEVNLSANPVFMDHYVEQMMF